MFHRGVAETQRLLQVRGLAGRGLCGPAVGSAILRIPQSLRFLLITAMLTAGCSIPNLQPEECTEARPAVREFFSFHFGNEMSFSQRGLALREKFLTPRFAAELKTRTATADPFTVNSDDVPRAFRVGQCEAPGPYRTVFDVLVFWRDNERTDQRTILVDAVKTGDTWLIDRVNY